MADTLSLSPDKQARLAAFLGALPAAAAGKLFAALEADRARGGEGLPYDTLLENLRDRLKQQGGPFPQRIVTAQRLFFTPFEDFFINARAGKKRRARIARSSLGPIWTVMMEDPACTGAARAAEALDLALARGEKDLGELEESLFNAAGQGFGRLVAHAETDAGFRDELSDRLGGAPALYDLSEIHFLLAAVDHFRAMQRAFPKPLTALTEEKLYEARRLYAETYAQTPEAAPWLLMAITVRMAEPWRALALYYHLSGASDEAIGKSRQDAAAIVESLFDDLENAARMLERGAEGAFDADDAALQISHFAEFADGLASEAGRVRDNVILNRIEACRDIAGDCLERFAEQSLAALRRAMPVRRAGGASRLMAFRPDIAQTVTPPMVAAAREAARFLAASRKVAARLGRGGAAEAVIADASEEAHRYLADLVTEIRAAEGDERLAARRAMERALEFAAPLIGETESELFKQRARAAALTA